MIGDTLNTILLYVALCRIIGHLWYHYLLTGVVQIKKRQEQYLQNRDYELESSRVRYNADAEQRRASARDIYRANLESNRASKGQ